MLTREDSFEPCATCEFATLCAWKDTCIAERAAANIRAETPPTYPCKLHAERIAVEPVSMRWCAECREDAVDRAVNAGAHSYAGRPGNIHDIRHEIYGARGHDIF